MSAAKVCDACNEFFRYEDDISSPNGITITHFDEAGKASHAIRKIELCPNCMNRIDDIVGNKNGS